MKYNTSGGQYIVIHIGKLTWQGIQQWTYQKRLWKMSINMRRKTYGRKNWQSESTVWSIRENILTCYQASPRHISSGQLTSLCNSPRTSHEQSQSLSAGKYSSCSIIGRAAYGKLAAGYSSSSSLEAKISTILFVALSWTQTHCDTANKKTGLLLRERMYIPTDHGRIILLG